MLTNIFAAAILVKQSSAPTLSALSGRAENIFARFSSKSETNQVRWQVDKSHGITRLRTDLCEIAFSDRAAGRPMRVSFDVPRRNSVGPKRGLRFKSKSAWEQYAFGLMSKIWTDIDGYVLEYHAIGEDAFSTREKKSWSSVSNTVTIIWMTHPVRGLQRQFSCIMDGATGNPMHLSCSPFFRNAPAKLEVEFDNSKLRKTKVGQPPPGMQGKPDTTKPIVISRPAKPGG